MKIQLNGKPRDVEGGRTVAGLLADLELDDRLVVVELNRQIVRRTEITDTVLEEGDRVEIVQFVGGG
jgi:thiamine biosynthesis protein ThiS